MCVKVSIRTMGCGKSRHHSPDDDSEIDLRNSSSSGGGNKNSSSNKNTNLQHAKKKKVAGSNESKADTERGGEAESTERSPSFKKISNGRSRLRDRNEEIGQPLSSSPQNRSPGAAAAEGASEKSNGATKPQSKSYLLEVPNEMSKADSQSKTTCKDFKSLTSTKTVHVTSSQIEFFKMLDEKIEKGGDYLTSGDTSEVSSLDETYRH